MGRSRSSGGAPTRRSSFGSQPSRSSSSTAAAPTATREKSYNTAPPPATTNANHPTAQQSAHSQAPAAGGGLLSGLASTVMQGMAFGGGSAVAHRAIDGVFGGREVQHVHTNQDNNNINSMSTIDSNTSSSPARANVCRDEVTNFNQCMASNNHNVSSCQFYFDLLNQCQVSSKQQLH
jgi:predicted lipid-binding transport protein (Tim44 family)